MRKDKLPLFSIILIAVLLIVGTIALSSTRGCVDIDEALPHYTEDAQR